MKIGRKPYSVGPIGPMGVPAAGAPAETEPPAPAAEDKVEITAGRELGEVKKALNAIPDVRLEKVETIRESVEDGTYYVESEKIAKRVVDEALEEAVRRQGGF
jgi:flagellar biosynthesis anti-sigma factor FlgM